MWSITSYVTRVYSSSGLLWAKSVRKWRYAPRCGTRTLTTMNTTAGSKMSPVNCLIWFQETLEVRNRMHKTSFPPTTVLLDNWSILHTQPFSGNGKTSQSKHASFFLLKFNECRQGRKALIWVATCYFQTESHLSCSISVYPHLATLSFIVQGCYVYQKQKLAKKKTDTALIPNWALWQAISDV